jgi:26S proteasome regulatory subunit N7
MGSLYKRVCADLKVAEDVKISGELKEQNDKDMAALEAKIEDAKKNLGETEVRDALLAKADYLATTGDKDAALKAYDAALEKTVGSGARIDVEFAILRLALCWNDLELIKTHLAKAKDFVEKGGDWERKNLLSVYEATHLILTRELKLAAKLLLDSVATFTAYKLFPYNTFIFYTVVCSVVTLDRVTLRDKVVKSPDILSVIRDVPNLHPFLFSLYNCDYAQFFKSLAEVADQLKQDRLFATHAGFIMRESRIVAYTQFLESYKSVTLVSMANAFGVSVPFLDKELARFISAGRLNCKIDKVGGIVETNRPDARNTQYAACIKQGDTLLNRIQKLSKVISV